MTPGARIPRQRPILVAGAFAAFALLVAELADARPGGGQTYRGSSRSSGGGGGGGGGGGDVFVLVYYLIELVVEVPVIGVPLVVVAILFFVLRAREGIGVQGWSSAASAPAPRAVEAQSARRGLEALRHTDPDFSTVLFEDFLHALFSEVHSHRGGNRLDLLSPYITADARAALAAHPATEVRAIVVGSLRPVSVSRAPQEAGGPPYAVVVFEVEANYTERDATKREQTYFVRERWSVCRSTAARSRPKDKIRTFKCPSCGAPLEQIRGSTCGYCHQVVDTGAFDWMVTSVDILAREERPPALSGDAPEVGTSDPTIVDSEAQPRWEALVARDPALDWAHFVARIELLFGQLQNAWATQDLARARPFVTDGLLETWSYWFEAYRAQGLRNTTEGARVATVHLARVVTDAVYDAVTVRIFASSLDYTLDASGRVVSGSRSKPRDYSEYWTLIRGRGKTGAPRAEPVCPSCGAPLAIEMTGLCTYCHARVTSGDFDWVLSRIEQDEAYEG
jgi:predicted RNA-binding Zn-ribbon protein involved in translation (DUF1610 family)